MRILLDANIPKRLKQAITGHEVLTARETSLEGRPDGSLFDVAEGQFDVLVTMDRSLQFQQRIKGRPITVAVLSAKSNRLKDLLPLVPEPLRILPFLRAGEAREIKL